MEDQTIRLFDGSIVERWECFLPNSHQLVIGLIKADKAVRLVWVDLGPHEEIPEMPSSYRSVEMITGQVNAAVKLMTEDGVELCFSTSEHAEGIRALAIGNYFDEEGWDVDKLRNGKATDIFNLINDARKSGQKAGA